jgi:hypothetical protein
MILNEPQRPSRLMGRLKVIRQKGEDPLNITSLYVCSCERHLMRLLYFGETYKSILGRHRIRNIRTEHGEALELHASCPQCIAESCIFNSSTDGYECVADGSNHEPSHFEPRLVPFECPKCKRDQFSIEISFEYSGLDEIGAMSLSNPGDAYSWIKVSLRCSACNAEYRDFLDYETS